MLFFFFLGDYDEIMPASLLCDEALHRRNCSRVSLHSDDVKTGVASFACKPLVSEAPAVAGTRGSLLC